MSSSSCVFWGSNSVCMLYSKYLTKWAISPRPQKNLSNEEVHSLVWLPLSTSGLEKREKAELEGSSNPARSILEGSTGTLKIHFSDHKEESKETQVDLCPQHFPPMSLVLTGLPRVRKDKSTARQDVWVVAQFCLLTTVQLRPGAKLLSSRAPMSMTETPMGI